MLLRFKIETYLSFFERPTFSTRSTLCGQRTEKGLLRPYPLGGRQTTNCGNTIFGETLYCVLYLKRVLIFQHDISVASVRRS